MKLNGRRNFLKTALAASTMTLIGRTAWAKAISNDNLNSSKSVCNSKPLSDFTFENYIVSASNESAYSAAYQLASNPGKGYEYCPLYIYGPDSLGKSHLLHAVLNKLTSSNLYSGIPFYCSAKGLVKEYISANLNDKMDQFKERYYESYDILAIDNIHTIGKCINTQKELAKLISHFRARGKQILIASKTAPSKINGISSELCTALESGLVVEIKGIPDDIKEHVIRYMAESRNIKLDDTRINYIAKNTTSFNEIKKYLDLKQISVT